MAGLGLASQQQAERGFPRPLTSSDACQGLISNPRLPQRKRLHKARSSLRWVPFLGLGSTGSTGSEADGSSPLALAGFGRASVSPSTALGLVCDRKRGGVSAVGGSLAGSFAENRLSGRLVRHGAIPDLCNA